MTAEKPLLRFPGFTRDWTGERLGSVSNVITGSTPSTMKQDLYHGNHLFITPGDMNSGRFVRESATKLTDNGIKYARQLPPRSTLFVCIGSTIGKTAQTVTPSSTNQQINAVVADAAHDPDFLYLCLTRMSARVANLAGKQAVPIIPKSQFEQVVVWCPSLPEQQKIADFLTSVDEKIESLKRRIDLNQKYKNSAAQMLFSNISGSTLTLGRVAKIKKGSQLNRDSMISGGSYPVLNGGIGPSGYTDDYNAEEDTITISEGGNSCGYVNYMTERFWCGGHCYSIEPTNINKMYLLQYLKFIQPQIMRLRVGSGLPNIQKADLQKLVVPNPGITEQVSIAKYLEQLDEKILLNESKLEQTKQFKQALLQQMFV